MHQPSLELRCLFLAMRVVLDNQDGAELYTLLQDSRLNIQKLEHLATYHQIRPLLFESFQTIGYRGKLYDTLKQVTRQQAIKNIMDAQETQRLVLLLQQQGIPILPYKGMLFWHTLYDKKTLRESADIDLVVLPANGVAALQVLIQDGYRLQIDPSVEIKDSLLHDIIQSVPIQEISLTKSHKGYVYQLDFHWALSESYQSYPIVLSDFFKRAGNDTDSQEDIFRFLLIHHGGRGCWLKLKEIADLYQCLKVFGNKIPYLPIAQELAMQKAFQYGQAFLGYCFHGQASQDPMMDNVLDFWDNALLIESIVPKLKYTKIQMAFLDTPIPWHRYLRQRVAYYAIINPFERKRIFVFPPSYIYWNALGKLVTYLFSRITNR